MRRLLIYCILLLSYNLSAAQSLKNYYRLPIDGVLSLSANYGELRPNHFHAGIDIRVGGVVGAPVYAAAGGYVSRISVSPSGYGKAVYITHPNGTTSVYGHLHNFSPTIKAYIENIQYARQRFAVDETLAPNALPVKKGTQIGNAGNSGSSLSPHLHFEVRDSLEVPIDIFIHNIFPVPTDTYPPTFRSVSFFSYRQVYGIPCTAAFYQQTKPERQTKQIVNVPDTFYVGMDVIDTQNGTPAKLAVNRINITVDEQHLFECRLEDIAFDVSLCINSAIAYEERVRSGNVLLKTHIEEGNKLPIYRDTKDNGLIVVPDNLPHNLQIKATDDAGNVSVVNFIIQKGTPVSLPKTICDTALWIPAYWSKENTITKNGLEVSVPLGALYQSIPMIVDSLAQRPATALSPLWRIHSPETPLNKAIIIRMAATLPEALHSKAVIVKSSEKNQLSSAGGRWHDGVVEANIRSFGDFFVTTDTVPPTIKPQFADGANLNKSAQLKIKITDNLSGVATYSAYIDGEWALFEHDAKSSMLIYTFDAKRIKQNKKHQLLLSVTDGKQNTASLQTSFTW